MSRGVRIFIVVIVVVIAALVALSFLAPKPANTGAATTIGAPLADPSSLPGLMTGSAPWPNNIATLADRLVALGFPRLSMEGTVMHIHQHIDIFVNGQQIQVPAGIGIGPNVSFYSPIHVHDLSGVIHVESPVTATFTLGQFFDVWGLKFTNECLGGYCVSEANNLKVYVNGKLYQGDPRMIPLKEHDEYAVVYGSATDTPSTIPNSYDFPAGL